MIRLVIAVSLALTALTAAARADEDASGEVSIVVIAPSAAPIKPEEGLQIGTVKLAVSQLVKKGADFVGTYQIRVIPFVFANETGTLSVTITPKEVTTLQHGGAIEYGGSGISNKRKVRRFDGKATAATNRTGTLALRIFAGKRKLLFNTSYELDP